MPTSHVVTSSRSSETHYDHVTVSIVTTSKRLQSFVSQPKALVTTLATFPLYRTFPVPQDLVTPVLH